MRSFSFQIDQRAQGAVNRTYVIEGLWNIGMCQAVFAVPYHRAIVGRVFIMIPIFFFKVVEYFARSKGLVSFLSELL